MCSDTAFRRRVAIAGRAPALSASQLCDIAALEPDLGALDPPDRALLAPLGLSPRTLAWFCAPDERVIDADLGWLDVSGCGLLPATSGDFPMLLRESPDAPAVLYVRGD